MLQADTAQAARLRWLKKINQPQIPFEYTYDSRGNIKMEKRGNLTTSYEYDAIGQLVRVN